MYYSFLTWDKQLERKRASRGVSSFPSHCQIHYIKTIEKSKRKFLAAATEEKKDHASYEIAKEIMSI